MSLASGSFATGLFIDGFAGGGGASTGIAQAIGRDANVALNHRQAAIAIHKANHSGTTHYCQDIRAGWPLAVTRMQPVAGMWMSPAARSTARPRARRSKTEASGHWPTRCFPSFAMCGLRSRTWRTSMSSNTRRRSVPTTGKSRGRKARRSNASSAGSAARGIR